MTRVPRDVRDVPLTVAAFLHDMPGLRHPPKKARQSRFFVFNRE
jgi:hypothetical protein